MKLIGVIFACVLACSVAFAQSSATLNFADPAGDPSCDYEQLASGTMAAPPNATVDNGPAYEFADDLYGAECAFSPYQLIFTQAVPSVRLHHYGWAGYVGFSGFEFAGIYGYLLPELPVATKAQPHD
jgi:hypothetical protein